jgi:hypothetical protein
MGQVNAVLTSATAGQAIGALMAAGLSRDEANLAAAQSADETASWKYMRNWNLGNITTADPNADWMIQSSTNPLHFASYSSLLDGAKAMVSWLSSHNIPLDSGIAAYVAALQQGCYLGCLPPGGTATQTDYDNYQAAITRFLPQMQAAVPVAPAWTIPKTFWVAAAIIAGGYVVSAAVDKQKWIPKPVKTVVDFIL